MSRLLSLLIVLLITSSAYAGELAGSDPVERLHIFSTNQLILYASGVVAAANTMGMACQFPPTAGELAAYLQYTAPGWQTASEALRTEWQRRGCTMESTMGARRQSNTAIVPAPAQDADWREVIQWLWKIRTTDQPTVLMEAIATAKTTEDTATAKDEDGLQALRLSALLATDRLRELRRSTGSLLPTQ